MGCCPGLARRIKNAGEMAAHRPGVLHVCALFRERFIFPLKLYRKAIVCDAVALLGGPLAKGLMGRVALMGNVRRKHNAARRQEAVRPEQARSLRHLICVHVPFALDARAIGVVQNGAGEGMSKAAQHCPDGGIEKETIRGIEESFFAIPQAIEREPPAGRGRKEGAKFGRGRGKIPGRAGLSGRICPGGAARMHPKAKRPLLPGREQRSWQRQFGGNRRWPKGKHPGTHTLPDRVTRWAASK